MSDYHREVYREVPKEADVTCTHLCIQLTWKALHKMLQVLPIEYNSLMYIPLLCSVFFA